MHDRRAGTPRNNFQTVLVMICLIAVPAAFALHTVKVSATAAITSQNPTPYGYTVSLLLFVVPILAILFWLGPTEGIPISKKSLLKTVAFLFPLGAALDFFFAHLFLGFPNRNATLHFDVPVLRGTVPIEEYLFYFTGFMAVLLIYIWLDEYWLAAYSVPAEGGARTDFERLIRFHPQSLVTAVILVGAGLLFRHYFAPQLHGFPGYFTFLVVAALGPSTALFPEAMPVINWRAFSLTLFFMLLTSLLWEATLALPYRWWCYQPEQMLGLNVTAWSGLPIEAVCVWIAVTYQTVIVYEIVRRWQSSGRAARTAFLGSKDRKNSKTPPSSSNRMNGGQK